MSSTPAEPANTPTGPTNQPQAPAQEPSKDWKNEADKAREAGDDLATWKAEARKWEAQAKANSAAAERLAELEEASKTEEQKRADQLAQLQAKVTEYETRDQIAAWKTEVATATGVPAAALAGATKEEIEAHAETLKPLIAQPQTTKPQPLIVPAESKTPLALNSTGLEDALRKAVGAN